MFSVFYEIEVQPPWLLFELLNLRLRLLNLLLWRLNFFWLLLFLLFLWTWGRLDLWWRFTFFGRRFLIWKQLFKRDTSLILKLLEIVEIALNFHITLFEEALTQVIIAGISDIRIFRHFFPIWPVLGLDYYRKLQKVVSFFWWGIPITKEGLRFIKQFFCLNLAVHLRCCHRIVRIDSINHLEENDPQGPDIGLNRKKTTFRP